MVLILQCDPKDQWEIMNNRDFKHENTSKAHEQLLNSQLDPGIICIVYRE